MVNLFYSSLYCNFEINPTQFNQLEVQLLSITNREQ